MAPFLVHRVDVGVLAAMFAWSGYGVHVGHQTVLDLVRERLPAGFRAAARVRRRGRRLKGRARQAHSGQDPTIVALMRTGTRFHSFRPRAGGPRRPEVPAVDDHGVAGGPLGSALGAASCAAGRYRELPAGTAASRSSTTSSGVSSTVGLRGRGRKSPGRRGRAPARALRRPAPRPRSRARARARAGGSSSSRPSSSSCASKTTQVRRPRPGGLVDRHLDPPEDRKRRGLPDRPGSPRTTSASARCDSAARAASGSSTAAITEIPSPSAIAWLNRRSAIRRA